MKFPSEFWTYTVFPTFIKASATAKNRYAQEVRYYTSADSFLDDFGDDEQAAKCANYFKEDSNGKTRTAGRRQVR